MQPPPLKRLLREHAPWLVHFKRRCESLYRQRQSIRHLKTATAAVAAFPKIKRRRQSGLPGDLIISLTSYPARFPTLAATLKSLLDQNLQADRVMLWVSDNDMSGLPPEVLELCRYGLTIRSCADTKSYKKLIPALCDFPDAFVVTADDDIYYPPNWLEILVGCVDIHRPEIIGTRAHIAIFDADGVPLPYTRWIMETKATVVSGPGQALFLTGIGGVLYPPRCLHEDATRQDLFMRLCPRGDDIWFFAMSELAGTPRRRAAAFVPLAPWPASQDVGLFHENVARSGNDRQLRSVMDVYGVLRSRFAAEARPQTVR